MRPLAPFLVSIAASLLLSAVPARAAWVVDAEGRCVQVWTTASLAHGPSAVVDSPLVPLRFAAGGVHELGEPMNHQRSSAERIRLKSLYVPAAMVSGLQVALTEMTLGFADTLTGGYFHIASDDAARFTLEPTPLGILNPEVPDGGKDSRIDPCGRPIFPLAESHAAED